MCCQGRVHVGGDHSRDGRIRRQGCWNSCVADVALFKRHWVLDMSFEQGTVVGSVQKVWLATANGAIHVVQKLVFLSNKATGATSGFFIFWTETVIVFCSGTNAISQSRLDRARLGAVWFV